MTTAIIIIYISGYLTNFFYCKKVMKNHYLDRKVRRSDIKALLILSLLSWLGFLIVFLFEKGIIDDKEDIEKYQ